MTLIFEITNSLAAWYYFTDLPRSYRIYFIVKLAIIFVFDAYFIVIFFRWSSQRKKLDVIPVPELVEIKHREQEARN